MEDFNMVGSMEKLNEYNYRDWKTCMKFYLKGHNLWEIVDGSQTSPPNKDDKSYESWNIKANKAMYILVTSMDKNVRSRIAHVDTPKEAWDILASLFSNKSTARLQLLEKELMNTAQGKLSIKEYFLKVKNLCREIEEIDDDAKFGDGRIRRIIINGLNPEYNSFIAAIQGWQTQPSLVELENLLVDQEALSQRMPKLTIKPDTEEALFTVKRPIQRFKKGNYAREQNGRKLNHRAHKSDSEDEENSDKEDQRQRQHCQPKRGECFFCGRKGHYAIECKFLKKIQSNFVKLENKDDPSEEEWDFEATYAVEEEVSKDEEWDFDATCAIKEDVPKEEDWDLSGQNDELWIEDPETEYDPEIAANTMIVKTISDQHEDDEATKIINEGHITVKEETEGFIHSPEEIEMVSTQPGVQDWLVDACLIKRKGDKEMLTPQGVEKQGEPNDVIQTKVLPDARMRFKEGLSTVIKRAEDEQNVEDDWKMSMKIEDHLKMSQIYITQFNSHGKLVGGRNYDQVTRDKFDIGANIKEPPDKKRAIRH